MTKFLKYIAGASLLLCILVPAQAQDSLSIEQCRSLAIEYNKQLKLAHYQQKEAQTNQQVARTAYLPSFEASSTIFYLHRSIDAGISGGFLPTAESEADAEAGNWSGQSNVYSPGMSLSIDNPTLITGGVSVTQPIFAGGKIRFTNKQADLGVEMSDYAYKLKFSEVVEMTDQAFWQVATIEANIQLAESYIEMLKELEDQMNQMYDVGISPASEKLKVSVQKNQAELQLLQARNGLKIAKMYLNQVLGRDLNAEVNIYYEGFEPELLEMSNGLALAMDNRNELKILEKKVELAKYDKKIARADYLPSVGVSAQYSTFYVNDLIDDVEFSPLVSGQITIPLFAWGQGKKKQKAASFVIQQRQEELSRTNDLISLEVMQVKVKVEEAYESILIAQKNIAEAEESLEETKASFKVGLNSTTDLLNAQAEWQQAKSQLISSQAQFKVLETSWERVTGMLTQQQEVP